MAPMSAADISQNHIDGKYINLKSGGRANICRSQEESESAPGTGHYKSRDCPSRTVHAWIIYSEWDPYS